MVAAVDGPARKAAVRTPAARSALPRLDDEMVLILLDDALDSALGNCEGKMHAFHGGRAGSGQHRPESIRRRPRKVSKSPQRPRTPRVMDDPQPPAMS